MLAILAASFTTLLAAAAQNPVIALTLCALATLTALACGLVALRARRHSKLEGMRQYGAASLVALVIAVFAFELRPAMLAPIPPAPNPPPPAPSPLAGPPQTGPVISIASPSLDQHTLVALLAALSRYKLQVTDNPDQAAASLAVSMAVSQRHKTVETTQMWQASSEVNFEVRDNATKRVLFWQSSKGQATAFQPDLANDEAVEAALDKVVADYSGSLQQHGQ